MIVTIIIWTIGLVLGIRAVLEIWRMPMSDLAKILAIVIIFVTSWIGLIAYYLFAKDKLPEWFKNVK